ncbi:MAG TPA: hypothetical protein VIF09_09280 [Polyangiaceae bacterium]
MPPGDDGGSSSRGDASSCTGNVCDAGTCSKLGSWKECVRHRHPDRGQRPPVTGS